MKYLDRFSATLSGQQNFTDGPDQPPAGCNFFNNLAKLSGSTLGTRVERGGTCTGTTKFQTLPHKNLNENILQIAALIASWHSG